MNATGKISLRNLKRVARELGETLGDEELQAMIDEFDTDGDGMSASHTRMGDAASHTHPCAARSLRS